MSPEEKEIQERKIRLMKIAMTIGVIWGYLVLALLYDIAINTMP